MFVRNRKVLTPLLYVSKPIGRSIWVQPAIGCDAINDDRGISKNAEEQLDVLGVESVAMILDTGFALALCLLGSAILRPSGTSDDSATIRIATAPATGKTYSS